MILTANKRTSKQKDACTYIFLEQPVYSPCLHSDDLYPNLSTI